MADPAQRGAARQRGHQRNRHPAGDGQRHQGRSAGKNELAKFRGGARIERQKKRPGKRGHGEKKRPNAGAVGLGYQASESRAGGMHFDRPRRDFMKLCSERHGGQKTGALFVQTKLHSGTETDSTISRKTDSVVSDFFCNEAWRELATTRCAKTGTASCLKSSGRQ